VLNALEKPTIIALSHADGDAARSRWISMLAKAIAGGRVNQSKGVSD
jgi:hypothetical protein